MTTPNAPGSQGDQGPEGQGWPGAGQPPPPDFSKGYPPPPAGGYPPPGGAPPPPGGYPPPGGQPPAPGFSQPGYPPPLPGYPGDPSQPMPFGNAPKPIPPNVASAGLRFGAYWLNVLLAVVTLGIGYIVWTMVLWQKGQTPAWQILKMRAVRADNGQWADFNISAMRNFVYYGLISTVTCGLFQLIGMFWVLNDDRQAVWDKMAKTYVIKEG